MKRTPEIKLELIVDPDPRGTLRAALQLWANQIVDQSLAHLTGKEAPEESETSPVPSSARGRKCA